MTDRGRNGPQQNVDHATFGEIYDVDESTDAQQEALQTEDPLCFLATDLDPDARIEGLESVAAVELWWTAERPNSPPRASSPSRTQ